MKVAVAIRQTPAKDSPLRIAPSGKWVDSSDLSFEINEPDAYALEAGLQLREKQGGEVVAVFSGPERVSSSILEVLAKGADRAIHVVDEAAETRDPLGTARLLAKALEPEQPDLILTGLQSGDLGYGQTGVILAELLGLPHTTLAVQIETAPDGLRVKRELEGGRYQWVEMPVPSLIAVQSGISRLRYATLLGIKKAKSKPVLRKKAEELAPGIQARSVEIVRLFAPPRAKQARLFSGDPAQAARQLVEYLKREARVL